VKRDKLGRRIGRNWWRELVVQTWRDAYDAWCVQLEAASNGWATEAREFRDVCPCPTLKATMVGLSGRWDERAA
jgi:hypothetical protein